MELRRTSFSSAEPIKESGYTRSWRIALPKTIFRVTRTGVTKRWLTMMADLQIGSVADFPGVFPLGNGRASQLPDNRKPPTPTYIIEWLLPELSKTTITVGESISSTKTVSSQSKFIGQGVPWRRSVHWNSIRFTTALAQRWYGFSLEQYKVLQLGFKTWLLGQYAEHNGVPTATIVNKQVEMLQRISLRARKLLAMGAAMEKMVTLVAEKCEAVQQQVDGLLPSIVKQKETENILPKSLSLQKVSGRFYLPDSDLQSLQKGSNVELAALKEDISAHVSPISFVESIDASTALDLLRSISEQLKQAKLAIKKQKYDLAMFTACSMLHGTENFIYRLFNCMCEEDIADLDNWAANLRTLAEEYATLIPTFKSQSPERRSREVLALWCLIALIDHVARRRWPDLFANVGMALPVTLLENLTFRERSLMQTAANLIARKNSFGTSPGLFDYTAPDATQRFAVKYFDSTEGTEMQSCLVAEREQEQVRTAARKKELDEAEEEYKALKYQPCSCTYTRNGYLKGKCGRCRRRSTLLATPTQVKHPLPTDDQIAKEVIFFACLPEVLKSYGAIVLKAYTLHDIKLNPVTSRSSQDCVDWAFAKDIQLPPLENSPVSLISHRKTLESDSHFKNTSAFTVNDIYPDFDIRSIAIDNNSISSFQYDLAKYQYELTGSLRNLNWMSNACHTENMVLASQHEMPVMGKRDFIGFGRVRAPPNLQIRELIMMIESASEQLKSDDFLILTQRVLFEMGPTLDSTECKWSWKRDLFTDTWLHRLHQLLLAKHAEIRPNWQSHAIMRLIIEISTFTLQFGYRAEFSQLLNEVCNTIHEWIEEVEQAIIESTKKAEDLAKWRWLLIQFYSYLLLGSLGVTEKDLQYRSELSRLKSVCGSRIPTEITNLLALVDTHIFNHSIDIHKLIACHPSMLHRMIAKVGIDLKEDMVWERVDENGKLLDWYSSGPYMINPISGLILCDGLTVSELPSAIVQKPLYQQVMKNASFIVQRVDNEYVTSHGDRKFKFGLWNQYPLIQERRGDREYTLLPRELLQSSGLPEQLVTRMAHWVDFNRRIIEFRFIDFHETAVHYEMNMDTRECFINDQKKSQLLNAYDGHLQELINQLTRITPVQHLIFSKSAINEFKVQLQCNLTFTLQENGEVVSDDYPGYALAPTQLVPTFPLFSEYFFIKPQSSLSTKLPLVLIQYEGKIYPYEFDEVHQRLIPPTTLARLVLAMIYLQTSCTTDPLAKTSGLQQAFILLQQCWQNSPFTSAEFSLLHSFMKFPEDSPIVCAIKMLIFNLVQDSIRVSFLHRSGTTSIPNEWHNIIQRCVKQYFKSKHTLPVGCTLDDKIEMALRTRCPPNDKVACNGLYFARVSSIFFSKETLPSTFNIAKFFQEDTTVSKLVGVLPSEWLKFGKKTNAELFFWFMKQISDGDLSQDQILTRLTFLAHNTLLKSESLDLLKCVYCALMAPGFCCPDRQLAHSKTIYVTGSVHSNDVTGLIPDDELWEKAQSAWTIYSNNYLDGKQRPTAFFHQDAFRSFYAGWKSEFLRDLGTLHNKRFIGRLFQDFSNELKKNRTYEVPSFVLIESTVFRPLYSPSYAWPVVKLANPNIKLDLLNEQGSAFEFVEKQMSQFYEAIDQASVDDLNTLRSEEKDLQERLDAIIKDRSKIKERQALNARLEEIQAILDSHDANMQSVDFPLQNQLIPSGTDIQSKIVSELKESYQKYFHSQRPTPTIVTDIAKYVELKWDIDQKRAEIWAEMERLLTSIEHPLLKLWQKTNLFMKPHQRIIPSLIRCLDSDCRLANPSILDTTVLPELALHFAVLHVHSIKLGRVIELVNDLCSTSDASDRQGFESQLYAELSDKREWSPRQHPEWLIFEMERRVCIRSIQVDIAMKMLEEKNIVLQLNMGEGKSKVIVPILCSMLANGQTLVRVNVLASLFHEVHSYLKLALGNMLGKRIYVFPFRRNVNLGQNAMTALRNQLEECKINGGIILSTPEHRLSLQLKYREVLWQYNHSKHNYGLTMKDFEGIIDVPILELLDESDEILRHKYQLIYTLGDQQSIEGGSARWSVHLALIRCIFMANLYQTNKDAIAEEYMDKALDGPAKLEALYNIMTTRKADFFIHSLESQALPTVRLINESFFGTFREELFNVFQLDPVWRMIAKGRSSEELQQLKDFVMNNYRDTTDGDKRCDTFKNKLLLDQSLKVPVLVLRGLLSFENNTDGSSIQGKDTPADGVEFGQPDMAIMLTILAHSTGIDLEAVKECFDFLKTKGINEQREIYSSWYKISRPIMNAKYVTLLEKIEAVNVENVNLMEHLAVYFGRNFEVVAYYLDNFVLPLGTRSFPEKIIANSWDLAKSSDKVIGFSGTDDTKHTLPLYVKQIALPSVESTNGKMIDILTNEQFRNTQYKSLPKEFESERILQEMCSHDNWNVLIDSGALIEGMSNREVVVKVLEICPRFQTGIFFDESNRLALIDRHGNSTQLSSSRPLEHSCFTYLDDIHTRGTDLPFPTKSHAFVTVATGITKDKLMQACMRMRKLVVGLHNVTFWGTSEVTMKIQQMGHNQGLTEDAITSVHILEWVVENTIKAQEEAIITYASQGFHHYASDVALNLLRENASVKPSDIINAVVLKEILATEDMYGIPLKSVNLKDFITHHGTRTKGELLGREIDQSLTEVARSPYEKLIKHSRRLVPTGKVVRCVAV